MPAGCQAVLPSQKHKCDDSTAPTTAAAVAWNKSGKLRPSGTQRRQVPQSDTKKACCMLADKSAVRGFFKS